MKILLYGMTIFLSAFLLHLLIWKIKIPRRQKSALLEIFLGSLAISFIILQRTAQLSILEYIHIFIFVISLALAYIITYSALEVDSPSLAMILNIAKSGRAGLGKERFIQIMNDDLLLKPRVADLVKSGLIYLDGNKYRLTTSGFLFIQIFIFYRRLLHLQKGG